MKDLKGRSPLRCHFTVLSNFLQPANFYFLCYTKSCPFDPAKEKGWPIARMIRLSSSRAESLLSTFVHPQNPAQHPAHEKDLMVTERINVHRGKDSNSFPWMPRFFRLIRLGHHLGKVSRASCCRPSLYPVSSAAGGPDNLPDSRLSQTAQGACRR